MRKLIVLLAAATGLCAQCEPTLAVREALENAWTVGTGLPHKDSRVRRLEMYHRALEQHPHEYFLLRMIMLTTDDTKAALDWARTEREKHPNQPVYALIYAQALEGRNTPDARRLLDGITAGYPELTRAHLVLADLSRWGKFKDEATANLHLASFLKACPAPLDTAPLRTVAQAGTKEQMVALAAAVRQRIVEMPQPLMAGVYEALWSLEFKATPPADHQALRTRITQDLARLEEVPERDTVRWLEFLRNGYRNSGNQERSDCVAGEILTKHPKSETAKRELQERWRTAHPYPVGTDMKKVEVWARAAIPKYEQWHRIWPDDSLLYSNWFSALLHIPDAPVDEVGRMGDKLVELYHANPSWWGFPPLEYKVADAFLKKDINVAKVPKLIEEGSALAEKGDRETLADDRLPDDFRKSVLQGIDNRRIERARILLTYYARTKNPDQAKAIEADLATLDPADARAKANLLERRGQAAEVLGRKLDALVLYRGALAIRPKAPALTDQLKENIERLWRELGGTPAAYAFLLDRAKPSEATDFRWEKPKKPVPAFSVFDLNGKTWTLDVLEGKTVLINVWATWCRPCRAEHPAFQKLYDELKTRPDISVISFNVDDDIGKVAPYVQQNKYTFPVLLAREVVDQVLESVAIPQNWFLNRNGKLEAVQVGYGAETGWRDQMLAKLEEIVKAH